MNNIWKEKVKCEIPLKNKFTEYYHYLYYNLVFKIPGRSLQAINVA